MGLNIGKCKVMHIGKNNHRHNYHLSDRVNESTHEEKDLGVYVSSNGQFDSHIGKVVTKANLLLGMVLNTFKVFNKTIAQRINPTFIRPHLEFAVPVWNPRLQRGINQLERVQRRATKSIKGFKEFSDEKRLAEVELMDLKTRRLRGFIKSTIEWTQ
jgi:hypothetical protein